MKRQIKLVHHYRTDKNLINKFHDFVSVVFPSISFREWYSQGHWRKQYIPFSLQFEGKLISNVCVTRMNIIVQGIKYKAIQIGAVGTLPEHRNKGYSSQLMNYVVAKYKNKVDFFFLYANESVLQYYPKFGFEKFDEYKFISKNIPLSNYSARKLNLNLSDDYKVLLNLIKHRQKITLEFGAEKYDHITMWHIINLYRNDLYFIQKPEVLIIQREENEILHIFEIVLKRIYDIETLIPKFIISNNIKKIIYYFPPDQLKYSYDKVVNEDTSLFILSDIKLGNNPFRFPVTAIT